MIALIQRVTRASVTVEGEVTGEIGPGLLVLLGVEKDDDEQKANRLCERVLGYRIFSDAEGKMNLNVQQAGGSFEFREKTLQAIALFGAARRACSRCRQAFRCVVAAQDDAASSPWYARCLNSKV